MTETAREPAAEQCRAPKDEACPQTAKKPAARKKAAPKAAAKKTRSAARARSRFIEVLRQTANVSRAAREAGIPSSTLYRQRARFAAFARQWDEAMNEALDMLEEVLIERARDGVEKPVYYGGEQRGTVRVYSDTLGMFMLRAKRPEIYNRGTVSPQAPEPIEEMTEAEAKAEFERLLARAQGRSVDN